MRRRQLIVLGLAMVALLACSCAAPQAASSVRPWTGKAVLEDADRFRFAIIGDITAGERPGVFEEALSKINLLQPAFVMSVGDLIQGYTEDPEAVRRQRESLTQKLDELDMRFYFVPGNHDITNDMMAEEWRRSYGPSYYHFLYRNVLFLCLNTEDPPRTRIGDEQARQVAKALSEHPDVRWTFVFMHEPLWLAPEDGAGTGWPAVARALAGRPHTVFAGHFHNYIHCERDGQDHIVLATTGGASELRGVAMGEFDQVAWVTMTAGGPVIADLKLDGILPGDVVSEEMNAAKRALERATYVKSDGIVSEEQVFRQGSGKLTLFNEHPYALTVRGEFAQHARLQAEPAAFEAQLAPGASRDLAITVTTTRPTDLTELGPLVLELSGTYQPPGFDAITLSSRYALAVHGTHEGPEIVENGSFDAGGEPWLVWVRSPGFGLASAVGGEVRLALVEPRFWWSVGIRQFVEGMRAGGRYRVRLRAANTGGRGLIHFSLKAGEEQVVVPLLMDGRTVREALIRVGETMETHVVEFTTARDIDLTKAKLAFGLGDLREARIDDVSVREILGSPPAESPPGAAGADLRTHTRTTADTDERGSRRMRTRDGEQ